jgi:hypothetical protein
MVDAGYVVDAILMLMIFTWVIKDTAISRSVQQFMLGIGTGYGFVISLKSLRDVAITPLLGGKIQYIIPIAFGLLFYLTFLPKARPYSRLPTILMIGTGLAVSIGPSVQSQIVEQIIATVQLPSSMTPLNVFNWFIIALSTLSIMSYFIFTTEAKGLLKPIRTIARYSMMIGFGANFANFIMGQQLRLLGPLQILLAPLIG